MYLGTFSFDKGKNDYGMVVLSNESKQKGVVCADAVRFGGGMGNIERGGETSGMPRYLEGARYSAQWAGMPYPVMADVKVKMTCLMTLMYVPDRKSTRLNSSHIL